MSTIEDERAQKLIKDLEENIYCRLRPSKVSGVGVFAIRDIPKGTDPFKNFLKHDFIEVDPKTIFENDKIDPAVKELVNDMYVIGEGVLHLWGAGLNALDMSFFINHTEEAGMMNMEAKEGAEGFVAARDIKKGEELLVDYGTYAENPD
jgi:SET domain-containing protein